MHSDKPTIVMKEHPASKLTDKERGQAFCIRHSSWNHVLVFLGPKAKQQALTRILGAWLADAKNSSEVNPGASELYNDVVELMTGDLPIIERLKEAITLLHEAKAMEDWDASPARIAGEGE